jgi:excisionase family DNA binding protein
MARRYNIRRVKIHRTYTPTEVGKLLNVHKHTVGRWIASGLPLIERKRRYLIHGADLRRFLAAHQPRKHPLRPGEMYCLRCRAPKRPAGDMADLILRLPAADLKEHRKTTALTDRSRRNGEGLMAAVLSMQSGTSNEPLDRLTQHGKH